VIARLVAGWACNVAALYVAALVIPDISYDDNWRTLVLAGLVFGLVNALVRPLAVLLALPAVILTLGLALFFVNALMLLLTDELVPSFEVGGFWSLMGGTAVVLVVNLVLDGLVRKPVKRRPRR